MIIIGTAGHIDHGKSSLVRALTGISTDRLKEEKDRGISIELGFAYLDLQDGQRCGLIDVPGHEKFVRHMIAGATGIDLVMLVVAADEGVMQQTREHLDICTLLGIKRGLVVLTKVDLVDDEWLELVESDLEDALSDTFLAGAPIVRFSAVDDATHSGMRQALDAAVQHIRDTSAAVNIERPTRLPIDRVFTMKGFGTVVTGTLSSGRIATGDTVEILPDAERAKVRGIESHGQAVTEARRGQRVAVNLGGVDVDDVSRGDVLSHSGVLRASRMLDVDFRLLPHAPRPFSRQTKVLVHVGTAQVNGTVVLLDQETLEPGASAPVQLRLDKWVVALGGDRVVIRGFEMLPQHGKTLGGGTVRHPVAIKHRASSRESVLRAFAAWRGDDLSAAVCQTLTMAGQDGAKVGLIQQVHSLSRTEADVVIETLCNEQRAYRYVHDGAALIVDSDRFRELLERAKLRLETYHQCFAHRPGMPREELRSKLRPDLPARYYAALLEELSARELVVTSERWIRLANFQPVLSDTLLRVREALLRLLDASGLEPPAPAEIAVQVAESAQCTAAEVSEVIDLLVEQGHIARVLERLLFSVKHIETLESQVTAFLEQHGEMSTPQLKELTGASRKFTVPLGEYLDAQRITIRVGDVRKLRGR